MTVITIQLPGAPGSPGPQGVPGPVGPSSTLTIGTVTVLPSGSPATAGLTGTAPNQVLSLGIPTGPQGTPGAAAAMTLGTVTTGAPGTNASASITGTAPNYVLNLTIPRGATGATGSAGAAGVQGTPGNTGATGPAGPVNTITIGSVTTGAYGTNASATITGAAPNQTLNLTIPQGQPGIPGTGGGPGTGVPMGGFMMDVLAKASDNDFDTMWMGASVSAVPNSHVARDSNGRTQVADPALDGDAATKHYVDTTAASTVTTHAAVTSTHGVSGNIVGTDNTQTLTNKTLTAPTVTTPTFSSYFEGAPIAAPASPVAGKYRFFVDTATKRWSQKDEFGFVYRHPVYLGFFTNAFVPTSGLSGDWFEHNPTNIIFQYNSAGAWRQVSKTYVADATGRSVVSGQLPASLLHVGLTVCELDTHRNYQWNGTTWEYLWGGTDPAAWLTPTFANGWVNYDPASYQPVRYKKTASGIVFIEGLMKLGTLGVAAFTLPAGYRPAQRLIFAGLSNTTSVSRLDANFNGDIYPMTGDPAFFSVTCSFFASA